MDKWRIVAKIRPVSGVLHSVKALHPFARVASASLLTLISALVVLGSGAV